MTEQLPFAVDRKTLLAPIPGREPAGEWLRYEGTYDAVQEARREDDESLPKGIWLSKSKRADWAKVDVLCQKALRERTKDLQLAVWLAEAWLQIYGLPGFAQGLTLCAELLTRFWETLYPVIDEGDTAYRLAPLEFLERKVALRLKQVPLTAPVQISGDEQQPLCFADWEQALHNEKHGQDRTSGEIVPSVFLAAAAGTPPASFTTLHVGLVAVDRAAAAVEAAVAEQTKETNSVLRVLHALVADIIVLIAQYTPADAEAPVAAAGTADQTRAAGAAEAVAEGAGADAGSAAGGRARSGGEVGPIKSRVEAYHRLGEAAEYLLRTEPHSPVPYLVKRAITWGNLNLMQLLSELVSSEGDRVAIYALLGIRTAQFGRVPSEGTISHFIHVEALSGGVRGYGTG